jgi:hypothetical protein
MLNSLLKPATFTAGIFISQIHWKMSQASQYSAARGIKKHPHAAY